MERPVSKGRQNALRAGLVVIGALAFGYLSLEVGFKPFLERAQEAAEKSDPIRDSDADRDDKEELWATPSDSAISFPEEGESFAEG